MAKLILQHTAHSGYWQRLPVYLNRTQVARIAFAERLELDLKPGRNHLAVGGFLAAEAETWFDIDDHNRAYELKSEPVSWFSHFPKTHQLQLIPKGPIQLPSLEKLKEKKAAYQKVIWQQFIFNAFYLGFAATVAHLSLNNNSDMFLMSIVIIMMLALWWINKGIRKFLLRKEGLS